MLARDGRGQFAPAAVVRHRWRAGTFADHLHERRVLRSFPLLARHAPQVAAAAWGGCSCPGGPPSPTWRSSAPWPRSPCVGRRCSSRSRPGSPATLGPARARRGPLALRVAQAATADLVGLASLVEGSLRHRRLVL